MGLIKGFKLIAQREGAISTMGIRIMKALAILGVVGVVGVIALGAAAQGTSGSEQTAKELECNAQADAQDFGIHEYQRHRFVIRCVAGLPQLGS